MNNSRLVALGGGEEACRDGAARTHYARGFAQCLLRVTGELERVHAEHDIEEVVLELQCLHVGDAQVGSGQALTGDRDEAVADVDAGHLGSALAGQHQCQPRAAPDVEDARARPNLGCVEQRLEQWAVVLLGEACPAFRVASPQATLHLGGGADHAGTLGATGSMFWFRRNTFSGSYFALTSPRRCIVVP